MELFTQAPELVAEEDYRMALATARFEREYDQVYMRTAQLLDAERDRVQCMEKLLLRIENESLQSQLNRTDQELARARQAEADAQLQLDTAIRELERLQDVVQTSSREAEALRRELASLNAIASDFQKTQAEKVRLSKEVSTIQLELERLRSQNTSANALLAEKQALTRQLNVLEVQLETEKRAHERTLAKGSQQTKETTSLATKLEEARRELDLARRHGQQMAHQAPAVRKPEGTSKNLEGARDGAPFSSPQPHNNRSSAKKTIFSERTTTVPLRGTASRLHSELNVATPGAIRAQKQQKQIPTMPGEKSSFSITPFLNRTTSLGDSTMISDDELNEAQSGGSHQKLPDLSKHARRRDSSPTATKQPSKPDRESSTTAAAKKPKIAQKRSLLDSPDKARESSFSLSHPLGQKQAAQKKRKLGLQRDRSLFDDDEEDNPLQDSRKPGRKLVGAGQTNLTGARAFTGPAGFSPLKRHKKRF
ncbi:hypothetical protein ASPCAL05484 [Aspergillus calidoustus]|uniref:Uncharacterized protein n=1 Tax=Aspergillus calidoustus TaxID=454130 RepID=A0A0U5FXG8_ASPCI|nr:hypothetical protein ASPCAL05484 [Aspergillus calidoustus]